MSELRLILLAAGVLLLLVIYLLSKRVERRSTARNTSRREPSFDVFVSDSDAVPASREAALPASASEAEPVLYEQTDLPLPVELRPDPVEPATETSGSRPNGAATDKEKVIVIHVTAKAGGRFRGLAIADAMAAESLEFGDFNIFHRLSGGRSLFSLASMVEPGTFDLDKIEGFSTPGLTMFLVLPGPDSPVSAFTEMLSTARRLAAKLGGEVLDESGSTLSRQAAAHLREQIIDFAHRIR